MVVHDIHFRYKLRVRILLGIIRIKAVNVREKNQKICVDQSRNDRRQAVIVTEPDLIRLNGVIFIDNRNDAERKELLEGIHGVYAAFRIHQGRFRQKKLGSGLSILREEFLIDHHQLDLSDRCAGLLLLEGMKRVQLHGCAPHSDRTGRYQCHVLPLISEICNLSGQNLDLREVESPRLCMDKR